MGFRINANAAHHIVTDFFFGDVRLKRAPEFSFIEVGGLTGKNPDNVKVTIPETRG